MLFAWTGITAGKQKKTVVKIVHSTLKHQPARQTRRGQGVDGGCVRYDVADET